VNRLVIQRYERPASLASSDDERSSLDVCQSRLESCFGSREGRMHL
jgi:hypothetical protein